MTQTAGRSTAMGQEADRGGGAQLDGCAGTAPQTLTEQLALRKLQHTSQSPSSLVSTCSAAPQAPGNTALLSSHPPRLSTCAAGLLHARRCGSQHVWNLGRQAGNAAPAGLLRTQAALCLCNQGRCLPCPPTRRSDAAAPPPAARAGPAASESGLRRRAAMVTGRMMVIRWCSVR